MKFKLKDKVMGLVTPYKNIGEIIEIDTISDFGYLVEFEDTKAWFTEDELVLEPKIDMAHSHLLVDFDAPLSIEEEAANIAIKLCGQRDEACEKAFIAGYNLKQQQNKLA